MRKEEREKGEHARNIFLFYFRSKKDDRKKSATVISTAAIFFSFFFFFYFFFPPHFVEPSSGCSFVRAGEDDKYFESRRGFTSRVVPGFSSFSSYFFLLPSFLLVFFFFNGGGHFLSSGRHCRPSCDKCDQIYGAASFLNYRSFSFLEINKWVSFLSLSLSLSLSPRWRKAVSLHFLTRPSARKRIK